MVLKKIVGSLYEYFYAEEIDKQYLKMKLLKDKVLDLEYLLNLDKVDSPEKLGEIGITELRKLLNTHCEELHISDRTYGLTNLIQAKKYTEETKVSFNTYQLGEYDCDEFSFNLMGKWNLGRNQFAFGIAWSKTHAFNIMIDDKKQIWIIEPQSNKFIRIENVKNKIKFYPMRLIII